MLKRLLSATAIAALLLAMAPTSGFAAETFTGEIVERACYVDRGAHGADHVACAKSCFSRGGEVGLLTDDGTLVLMRANPDDDAPFEALKEWAGQKVTVTGEVGDEDGMKTVVVQASEAATT